MARKLRLTEFVGMGGSGKSYLHIKYRQRIKKNFKQKTININSLLLERLPPLIKAAFFGWLIPLAFIISAKQTTKIIRFLIANRINPRFSIYYLINFSITILLKDVNLTFTSDQFIVQSVISILASKHGSISEIKKLQLVHLLLPDNAVPNKVYFVITDSNVCFNRLKSRSDSSRSRLLKSGMSGIYWLGFSESIYFVISYLRVNKLSNVVDIFN